MKTVHDPGKVYLLEVLLYDGTSFNECILQQVFMVFGSL